MGVEWKLCYWVEDMVMCVYCVGWWGEVWVGRVGVLGGDVGLIVYVYDNFFWFKLSCFFI